ncbi:hypothetical protein A2U01_0101671, partial [Trifolium medium]|nr:hypothetical protein [Trifolium medium]
MLETILPNGVDKANVIIELLQV